MYVRVYIYVCMYVRIYIYIYRCACIYLCVCIYIRGAYDKFPDIFRMSTFIDSTHMKL